MKGLASKITRAVRFERRKVEGQVSNRHIPSLPSAETMFLQLKKMRDTGQTREASKLASKLRELGYIEFE